MCCALYLQYPSPRDSHSSLLHILYVFAKGYLLSQAYPVSLFKTEGIFLAVQWLRPHAPNAGGPGSIPGQGTRSYMPQLRVSAAK